MPKLTVEITLDNLKRLTTIFERGGLVSAEDMRLMLAVVALTVKQFEDTAFSLGTEMSKAALRGEKSIVVQVVE